MKSLKFTVLILAAGFLAGCQNDYLVQESGTEAEPLKAGAAPAAKINTDASQGINQPVENLKMFNKVAPARIPVRVIYQNNEAAFSKIRKSIIGNIANAGYEVTDQQPYLSIVIEDGKLGKYDKFGNYYTFKGRVSLTVHRNAVDHDSTVGGSPRLLARTTLKAKGAQKLDIDEATDDVALKLSKEAANWTREVCVRELKGIQGVKVLLPTEHLYKAFWYYTRDRQRFEQCLTLLLKKIAAQKDIFYCRLVGKDSDNITLEVLYRKKAYPNGPFADLANHRINLRGRTPEERVDEFLKYMMR